MLVSFYWMMLVLLGLITSCCKYLLMDSLGASVFLLGGCFWDGAPADVLVLPRSILCAVLFITFESRSTTLSADGAAVF